MGQCKNILFLKLLSIRKMAIYPPTNNTEGICLPRAAQSQCDRGGSYSTSMDLLSSISLSALQFGWNWKTSSCQREHEKKPGIISRTRLLRTGMDSSPQLLERMKGKNSKLWSGEIKSNPAPWVTTGEPPERGRVRNWLSQATKISESAAAVQH